MSNKLMVLLLISMLLIEIDAQGFMGGGRMFKHGGMKSERFQRMRQYFQSMSPTQRMEARNIFMQNKGNRPAMRAAFEQWASRQGGQVQQMYQQYMAAKQAGKLSFQQQQS